MPMGGVLVNRCDDTTLTLEDATYVMEAMNLLFTTHLRGHAYGMARPMR